jgi:hypothetical protein
MMKPLPDVFSACCFEGDRWFVVSASEWSLAAGRTFDRRELRAIDSGKLGITSDDAPIVSQLASLSSVTA